FVSEIDGQPVEWDKQPSFSPLGNLFFTNGRIWDSNVGLLFGLGHAFDPSTRQLVNPEVELAHLVCGNDYSDGENPTSQPVAGHDPGLYASDGGMNPPANPGVLAGAGGSLVVGGASLTVAGLANVGILGTAGAIGVGAIAGVGIGLG